MTQAEKDRQFLIEYLAKDLIEMLVKDKGLSVRDAFDVLYQSETFKKVENQAVRGKIRICSGESAQNKGKEDRRKLIPVPGELYKPAECTHSS